MKHNAQYLRCDRAALLIAGLLLAIVPCSAQAVPGTIDELRTLIGHTSGESKREGNQAYQRGRYDIAADRYLAACRENPADGVSFYNLACCYGLLGKDSLAAVALQGAVSAGYDGIDNVDGDTDFDRIRNTDVFDKAVDSLKAALANRERLLGRERHVRTRCYLRYRIRLPKDYDPRVPHPVIIGLHGYGNNPENFMAHYRLLDTTKFIYAAPQAPYLYLVGSHRGFSWHLDDSSGTLDSSSSVLSRQFLADLATALRAQYRVNGIYLFGFSQGGEHGACRGDIEPIFVRRDRLFRRIPGQQ